MFALLIAVIAVLWIAAAVLRFGDACTTELHVNQALADETRVTDEPITAKDGVRAA